MLFLGARCCCDRRSLAVLAMLSLGNLVLAFAVCCRSLAVFLLVMSTGAAAVHLLCIGDDMHYSFGKLVLLASAVYCRLFAVLVLSTAAAAAVHLLSLSWRYTLLGLAPAAAVVHLLCWCYLLLLQASTVGCLGDDVLSW
ncbi:hypothetical protein MAM1_0134c06224 [Mucor ambiguus]|uniref:Uncharacterized protein n=1 Tax=Mucor ambiguus TaxID=91626 RepID=A0A0C9M8R7_9FUNG|nr:hypothetical protein MAM1_0134c06224 [Mucor ambiguus]